MNKYFKLGGIPFFLFVFFLMSSCADNDSTATNTTTAASTNTTTSTDGMPATNTLHKIWVSAEDFKKLDKRRLVFSFATEPDFITLYGWSCKGNSQMDCKGEYDLNPNLKLKKGQPSDADYGPVVFWDNLILEKSEVEGIQGKIGTGPDAFKFVLFVPENKNGHFNYSIILTHKDPTDINATSTWADQDTEIDANPSPPKNSSN